MLTLSLSVVDQNLHLHCQYYCFLLQSYINAFRNNCMQEDSIIFLNARRRFLVFQCIVACRTDHTTVKLPFCLGTPTKRSESKRSGHERFGIKNVLIAFIDYPRSTPKKIPANTQRQLQQSKESTKKEEKNFKLNMRKHTRAKIFFCMWAITRLYAELQINFFCIPVPAILSFQSFHLLLSKLNVKDLCSVSGV